MKNKIRLDGDPLFIKERLQEIDPTYYIVYNLITNKYEVHSCEQQDSYCFSIPYDILDDRTLELARKSLVSRRDQIIEEIDRENEQREKRLIKEAVDKLKEVLE